MSRTYIPTRNDIGVRDISKSMTLGGYLYSGYRGPAEPAAKSAMNPVNLGAFFSRYSQGQTYFSPAPVSTLGPVSSPVTIQNPGDHIIFRPIVQGPQPPAQQIYYPPPVQRQSSPTPIVTVPPAPPPAPVQITSGGGTASPAPAASSPGVTPSPQTSTVVTAAPGLTDQVATWLGGTTPIGSWNVPNALLAGGVILGAALLMNPGGRKR